MRSAIPSCEVQFELLGSPSACNSTLHFCLTAAKLANKIVGLLIKPHMVIIVAAEYICSYALSI